MITPLADETKKKMLSMLEIMDNDSRYKLETLCWETLAKMNELEFKKESARLLQEVEEGKRKYNPSDFTEARVKILHNLREKLHLAETEEELAFVRKKLEEHSKKDISTQKN